MNKIIALLLFLFLTSSWACAQNTVESEQNNGFVIRKSADTIVFLEQSNLFLKEGELLVYAERNATVIVDRYRLILSKGAIALLSCHKQVVKVQNMVEEKRASLKICINRKELLLGCGEEIVIAPNESALHSAISNDLLIRRNSNLFNLSSGGILVHSEFLPFSLIKQSPVLIKLAHCPNKQDKVMYGKILKMAACLGHTTSSHGNYSMLTE